MRAPTKKLVYMMCLISALFNISEIALAFVNIQAALFVNGAMVFFCIGMLFNIAINQNNTLAISASVVAICLSLFSTIGNLLSFTMLAFPCFAIVTVKSNNKLASYSSIAVIILGILAFIGSLFALPATLMLYFLAVKAINNAIFCVVMIKNKEIISHD